MAATVEAPAAAAAKAAAGEANEERTLSEATRVTRRPLGDAAADAAAAAAAAALESATSRRAEAASRAAFAAASAAAAAAAASLFCFLRSEAARFFSAAAAAAAASAAAFAFAAAAAASRARSRRRRMTSSAEAAAATSTAPAMPPAIAAMDVGAGAGAVAPPVSLERTGRPPSDACSTAASTGEKEFMHAPESATQIVETVSAGLLSMDSQLRSSEARRVGPGGALRLKLVDSAVNDVSTAACSGVSEAGVAAPGTKGASGDAALLCKVRAPPLPRPRRGALDGDGCGDAEATTAICSVIDVMSCGGGAGEAEADAEALPAGAAMEGDAEGELGAPTHGGAPATLPGRLAGTGSVAAPGVPPSNVASANTADVGVPGAERQATPPRSAASVESARILVREALAPPATVRVICSEAKTGSAEALAPGDNAAIDGVAEPEKPAWFVNDEDAVCDELAVCDPVRVAVREAEELNERLAVTGAVALDEAVAPVLNVAVGVAEPEGVPGGVRDAVSDALTPCVRLAVTAAVPVAELDAVPDADELNVSEAVGVKLDVDTAEALSVPDAVIDADAPSVSDAVAAAVTVAADDAVTVPEAVIDGDAPSDKLAVDVTETVEAGEPLIVALEVIDGDTPGARDVVGVRL